MQIKYSNVAIATFQKSLEFLEKNWSQREVNVFLDDVEGVINELAKGNFQQYQKSVRKTRSALIGKKHIRMFFRKENDSQISILLFFDMRQNPKKITELLK